MPEARRIPGDHPDARAIVAAMEADIESLYGPIERTVGASPDELSAPGGAFVAIYEDGRCVAGGGVKRLEDSCGEIKRMYVLPQYRGRGLGRLLLAEIEAAARGERYDPGDPAYELDKALEMAAMQDGDLLRAYVRIRGVITPADEVLADPALVEKVQALGAGWREVPVLAPSRAELLELVA